MLRNLMEEKQLDFNAPFLSVRRFASSTTSEKAEHKVDKSLSKRTHVPSHKSELKSGPLQNAGSIPFLWEQAPGRPKERGGPPSEPFELPTFAPKLPPGRTFEVRQHQQSSPGPLEAKAAQALVSDSNFIGKGEDASYSDEDYDDALSDALDTLSHTDSFFMKCSLSELSALNGPDLKPPRRLSLDPETRDFMMDRFLPAAKAMASETPQYASKRPAAARELARDTFSIDADKRTPSYQYRPHGAAQAEDEEKSEEDDEDYDDTRDFSAKACGLLPRFCLNSSLLLFNPVPGMKVRSRLPSSSASCKLPVSKATTGHGYLSNTDDEHSLESVFKYKLARGIQPHGTYEDGRKPASELNRLTYWSDSQTLDGSSSGRLSAGDVISPHRNEATRSSFPEGISFLGVPKQVKNLRVDAYEYNRGTNNFRGTLKSHHGSEQGSNSPSPTVEKILYVDSLQVLETQISISSSDTMERTSSSDKEPDLLVENKGLETDSLLEAHLSRAGEREALQLKSSEVVDPKPRSYSGGSILEEHYDSEGFHSDDHLDQDKIVINIIQDADDPQLQKAADQGNSFSSSLQPLLPPPLPKSPSESWLSRALHTVPLRSSFPGSNNGIELRMKKQALKASSTDPKWENIVKTSNGSTQRTRFLEVLPAPVTLGFINFMAHHVVPTLFSLESRN